MKRSTQSRLDAKSKRMSASTKKDLDKVAHEVASYFRGTGQFSDEQLSNIVRDIKKVYHKDVAKKKKRA